MDEEVVVPETKQVTFLEKRKPEILDKKEV